MPTQSTDNNDRATEKSEVALNFFQECLKHKDSFLNQMLVRNKVVHGVLGIIQETNGGRKVLNTACLDFFGYILRNTVKLLVSHIEGDHKETIKELHYIPVIKKMLALQDGGHDAEVEEKVFTDQPLP
ncbi:Platinum sensitivity protein [Linnemannia exigua]|uniref:Platinum sensitivity protein n=1 Tax=Linnemannia exigua TaxID=604196 RepID=A0AAD4DMD6_9FUNG|nr:Platinum sensitivity protein [Linnemannia exigua]